MAQNYEIPLLTANDIECRVQSVAKNRNGKVGATLLLYKDARVDMRFLDDVFGRMNWQRTQEVVNGNLFCNIDIWDSEKKCWVRKQDVGTESNTEKEKGQASDAFKRAGTNVGIGRELYTSPFIYVELEDGEYYERDGKIRASNFLKFSVTEIGYNERREISALKIADNRGTVRYTFGTNSVKKAPAKPKAENAESPVCKKCGKKIVPYPDANGKTVTVAQHCAGSEKRFGVVMCIDCISDALQK